MSQGQLIVMAKPPPPTLNAMVKSVRELGLDTRLGSDMFDPENWHQTLSARYPDRPEIHEALAFACSRVSAERFSLSLDRIAGSAGDTIHCEFRAPRRPKGMTTLNSDIQRNLQSLGIADDSRKRPHVTISYRAPVLVATIPVPPIHWLVDHILLVRSGGIPYRYAELGRWPLALPSQLDLFS